MKLIVCEKCEAEYKITHNMHESFYVMSYCTFCGYDLSEEFEYDLVEWEDDEN